jgi:hypothetical protein
VGHIRDFFGKRFRPAFYRHLLPSNVSCPLLERSCATGCFSVFVHPLTCVIFSTGLCRS